MYAGCTHGTSVDALGHQWMLGWFRLLPAFQAAGTGRTVVQREARRTSPRTTSPAASRFRAQEGVLSRRASFELVPTEPLVTRETLTNEDYQPFARSLEGSHSNGSGVGDGSYSRPT